ncbi:MAG: methionine biosynthesis protein MetW [Hyphomicrobiales bacterium]|nr:methionine biosynthesis protein MetW [Hyphomicrobiales bacterium]
MTPKQQRTDLMVIADMVAEGARVLDIGCENGDLLHILTRDKNVDGRGMELSQEGVNACVARGLAVIQGDAEFALRDYPDRAFDYVILSQTLQAMSKPADVLEQMLRIGKRAIVSFPNFAYWRVRMYLALRGRMPVTEELSYAWYETPNTHFCTILDFVELSASKGYVIEKAVAFDDKGRHHFHGELGWRANLFAQNALFLLRKD